MVLAGAAVDAQEWKASGWVEQDARRAFPRDGGESEWERVQSSLALRLEGERDHLRVVADGRLLFRGEPGAERALFGERQPDDRLRIDGDALFVEARGGTGWVRLGRQSVRWGRGLIAAPGSLVSPPDLEDPLRFGSPRGSEMVRVLAPLGPLKVEAIAVHAFAPALLPAVDERLALANSGNEAAESLANDPAWTIDLDLRDPLPPATFANAPLALRVTGDLPWLATELGVSAYRGRSPIPEVSRADLDVDFAGKRLSGDVTLAYPRLRMFAADAALEVPVPWLDAIGVFGEAAWIEPEPFEQTITALGADQRQTLLDDPYWRGVAGVERAGDTYLALEFSRGFFDEVGASRQHDYVFAIAERRFLRDSLGLRVVAATSLSDGSVLLAPDLAWSPRDALTLSVAAYAGAGSGSSKFAGPLSGDRIVLARARASF